MTVTVLNEKGDRVAGVECIFSIHAQPGSGASVKPRLVTTGAEGRATATLMMGSTVGIVEVRADCDGTSQLLRVEVKATVLPTAGVDNNGSGSRSVVVWLIVALAVVGGAAVVATAARWPSSRVASTPRSYA